MDVTLTRALTFLATRYEAGSRWRVVWEFVDTAGVRRVHLVNEAGQRLGWVKAESVERIG